MAWKLHNSCLLIIAVWFFLFNISLIKYVQKPVIKG